MGKWAGMMAAAMLMSSANAQEGSTQTESEPSIAKQDTMFNDVVPDVAQADVAERILDCTVRHATNIDVAAMQREDEITYGKSYSLTIALAPGRVPIAQGANTREPDKTPSAAYRVVTDPGGLFTDIPAGFNRVADYWPKHVEMGQTTRDGLIAFVILDQDKTNPDRMTAFISRAPDAVMIDTDWIHRGSCIVRG